MRTICPHCKKEFEVAEDFLNQNVTCTNCNQDFNVQEVKTCARCGTSNPHDALVCRKCHLDLTAADALRGASGEAEKPEVKKTSPDRWKKFKEKAAPIAGTAIKLLVVAAIAAGAWFGYNYYTGKKQAEENRKQAEEKQQAEQKSADEAYQKLCALEEKLNTRFSRGANLDNSARNAAREAMEKVKTAQDLKERAEYVDKANFIYYAKLRDVRRSRLESIDEFIKDYDAIMSAANLPTLTENTKDDLRTLVLISETDAPTVLKLKQFPEVLKTVKSPKALAEHMERELTHAEKEDLLIVYFSGKNWKSISRNAGRIISSENFPQQFLSERKSAELDRTVEKSFPADGMDERQAAAKKSQLKNELARKFLSEKWRQELLTLKKEEYREALAYYSRIKRQLGAACNKLLTEVLNDHRDHFSHRDFANLEYDYRNRNRNGVGPEKREQLEKDRARLLAFARESKRTITVEYYDKYYFTFCSQKSPELMKFGLSLKFPPPKFDSFFDKRAAKDDFFKKEDFREEYSPTALLAEIERVDNIIAALRQKIPNIELLSGVFLFPKD